MLLPTIIVAEAFHLTPALMLITIGSTHLAVAVLTRLADRHAWRLPEHALFWRSALAA